MKITRHSRPPKTGRRETLGCRFDSCTVHNIRLIDVSLRHRHFAAHPEGAASYLQSRRGLLPLVFVKINAALDPAYRFFIKPAPDDITCTQVFLDVKLEDLIENFLWRQGVLIFLICVDLCAPR